MNRSAILLIAAATTVLVTDAREVAAAPYETVAVYAKVSSPTTRKEIVLEDVTIPSASNTIIPGAFTDEEGVQYRLDGIEQRLSIAGTVDKQYLAPFWNFTVSAFVGGKEVGDSAQLSKDSPSKRWSLGELNELTEQGRTIQHVRISTKGSYSAEFLCGMEEIYRQKNGKESKPKPAAGASLAAGTFSLARYEVHREGAFVPSRVIVGTGGRVILFSFCNAQATGAGMDGVDWEQVVKKLDAFPELRVPLRKGEPLDERTLREAHKEALVALLFGADYNRSALAISEVAATGRPTNLVIESSRTVAIWTQSRLYVQDTEEQREVSGNTDQATTLRLDLDESNASDLMCGLLASPPYLVVLFVIDDKGAYTAIKPATKGPACSPQIDVKLSDYLGKKLKVGLVYQMPGRDGRVIVSETDTFTVRQLGLIATLPIASEIYAARKATSLSAINATSSIPVSWAIRTTGETAGRHAAVTFPAKLGLNTRRLPELFKYFAIYGHVSFVFPVDKEGEGTLTLGVGASLVQFLNIGYAWAENGDEYVLLGLSVQDVIKALK